MIRSNDLTQSNSKGHQVETHEADQPEKLELEGNKVKKIYS